MRTQHGARLWIMPSMTVKYNLEPTNYSKYNSPNSHNNNSRVRWHADNDRGEDRELTVLLGPRGRNATTLYGSVPWLSASRVVGQSSSAATTESRVDDDDDE